MGKKARASRQASKQPKITRAAPAPNADTFARIRGVNIAWCRAVPAEAISTGAFDVRKARELKPELSYGPDLADVADGFYRVEGSDWILTVGGGELAEVQKARPDLEYHDLVSVPSQ